MDCNTIDYYDELEDHLLAEIHALRQEKPTIRTNAAIRYRIACIKDVRERRILLYRSQSGSLATIVDLLDAVIPIHPASVLLAA